MYKRAIIPLYILIISLVASSLVIKPKKFFLQKFHRLNLFVIGILLIVISQVSIKFIGKNIQLDIIFSTLPILLVLFYYAYLFIKHKFTFKML